MYLVFFDEGNIKANEILKWAIYPEHGANPITEAYNNFERNRHHLHLYRHDHKTNITKINPYKKKIARRRKQTARKSGRTDHTNDRAAEIIAQKYSVLSSRPLAQITSPASECEILTNKSSQFFITPSPFFFVFTSIFSLPPSLLLIKIIIAIISFIISLSLLMRSKWPYE